MNNLFFLLKFNLRIFNSVGQIQDIKKENVLPFVYTLMQQDLEYLFISIFIIGIIFFLLFLLWLYVFKAKKIQLNNVIIDDSLEVEPEKLIEEEETSQKIDLPLSNVDNDSIPNIVGTPIKYFCGNYQFYIRAFKTQKLGLNESECEDQFSISSPENPIFRAAIADGATESLFSDLWADNIVKFYSEMGEDFLETSNLKNIYKNFIQATNQNISNAPDMRQWFLYEKLEKGTHVTFAGCEFSDSKVLKMLTVGDSCIFWNDITTNKIYMLPELKPEDFGAFPYSICHLPETWDKLSEKMVKKEILLEKVTQIILCTDALACWLSEQINNDNDISLETLFQISNDISFLDFINEKRNLKEMKNDDVTLVLINVLPINV